MTSGAPIVQQKICMLGAFAVGKTSLVSRFVDDSFSDAYLSTVGVKISKKTVPTESAMVDLIIWDIYGEDEFQKMRTAYLSGASGFLLVVDVTRPATLDVAQSLQALMERTSSALPFLVLLNKSDLAERSLIDAKALAPLRARDWRIVSTSAKTGEGVEAAFRELATALAARR
jgi:small GTP-binding protein